MNVAARSSIAPSLSQLTLPFCCWLIMIRARSARTAIVATVASICSFCTGLLFVLECLVVESLEEVVGVVVLLFEVHVCDHCGEVVS